MTRISHILVATDLTDRSDRAIERALQLQRQTGATLMLLHVIEPGLMGLARSASPQRRRGVP